MRIFTVRFSQLSVRLDIFTINNMQETNVTMFYPLHFIHCVRDRWLAYFGLWAPGSSPLFFKVTFTFENLNSMEFPKRMYYLFVF